MKQVASQHGVQPDQVGPFTIARALPNAAAHVVGPVMLLDHMPPGDIAPGEIPDPDGSVAHPHRGIATFTYVLGEASTHADSAGGNSAATAGGVQWMKSGNGIVHDEMIPADLRTEGGKLHSFQFRINLPARHKAEPAQCRRVPAEDLPVAPLLGGPTHLKVRLGAYEGEAAPDPRRRIQRRAPMPTRVAMARKIAIDKPREVVFEYIADLGKDPVWRTEFDRMEVRGPVEYSALLAA